MGNLFLEASDNLQTTRQAVLRTLSSLGYKLQDDAHTRIVARHPLSFTMYPHTLDVVFDFAIEKTNIQLIINHRASGVYLQKVYDELLKSLPTISQISDLGGEKVFLGMRIKESDVKELDKFLAPNEKLQAIFSGTVAGRMSSIKAQWLVVTDRRIIFYGRAFIGGGSDSFTYNEISSVQGQKGVLLGSIQLNIKGKTEIFENMQKPETDFAVNIIRQNIEKSKDFTESTVDPLEQLKKLKELLDIGAISEEEYQEKKQILLRKI